MIGGCVAARDDIPVSQLLAKRAEADKTLRAENKRLVLKLVDEAKHKTEVPATQPDGEPTVNILIISGGGDWGAFGAGVLKGWAKAPGTPRPQFDVVTGVSTGALIAPFAFIGSDDAIETVVQLYRHPQSNWITLRWPFYFWPNNPSFATVPGLEKALRTAVDDKVVRTVATESKAGRSLLVNTTNIDDGGMFVWDVGVEAEHIGTKPDISRIHDILLASSGIPAAFPFREIDGSMYVDGGISGNVLYGGRLIEGESFPAVWHNTYPALPEPRTRIWVIFNNQVRPLPQITERRWPAIVSRTTEIATRSATLTSLRHLFAQAEISRLKRGSSLEVRYIAVPDGWIPPEPGAFKMKTMNGLADLGEKMGADPASWSTQAP